jgi:hypothetical protein
MALDVFNVVRSILRTLNLGMATFSVIKILALRSMRNVA